MARWNKQHKDTHPRIKCKVLNRSYNLPIWELTPKQIENWRIALLKQPYERNLHETILLDTQFTVKRIMDIFGVDADDVRYAEDEISEMYGCW